MPPGRPGGTLGSGHPGVRTPGRYRGWASGLSDGLPVKTFYTPGTNDSALEVRFLYKYMTFDFPPNHMTCFVA